MAAETYDAIIVGSGAGGASVAYQLVNAGRRVLVLERGGFLPRDGSTLSVKQVFKDRVFSNKDIWVDGLNQKFVPDEFYNVGGKTKWYGAALFRLSAHEFDADEAFSCLAWPFGLETLAPYYSEAEALLSVDRFKNEPDLQALIDRIVGHNPNWKPDQIPLGLKHEVLNDPEEAKHFDGFASVSGYKSDAEWNILDRIKDKPGFTLRDRQQVMELIPADGHPERVTGVRTADGSQFLAPVVVLAAGAMTSPRILQDYLAETGLSLACADAVGANFKFHINSAILGLSPFKDEDVLRKTAIFTNEACPHSTIQCLGWIDGEILGVQLPAAVPTFLDNLLGARAIGFFATTEDGSSRQNRIISGRSKAPPVMDYRLDRIQASLDEHHACVDAFERSLLGAGLVSVNRYMGMAGTAHAMGSLVAGTDPVNTVVDPNGKVHGMEGLYVGDGSVLPRASRVNPSLTIYSWGLRLGEHLGTVA
jgi:choline dehydrogenase-like flavoprotein